MEKTMLDVKNLRKDKANYRVISRETEHAVLISSLSYNVYRAEQLQSAEHLMVFQGPTLPPHIRHRLRFLLYCGPHLSWVYDVKYGESALNNPKNFILRSHSTRLLYVGHWHTFRHLLFCEDLPCKKANEIGRTIKRDKK